MKHVESKLFNQNGHFYFSFQIYIYIYTSYKFRTDLGESVTANKT